MSYDNRDLAEAMIALTAALMDRGVDEMPEIRFKSYEDFTAIAKALAAEALYPSDDKLPAGVAARYLGFDFVMPKPYAGGWMPIEAAPKDETLILSYDGISVEIIFFQPAIECWITADGDVANPDPTHWMPLPPPPPALIPFEFNETEAVEIPA
jgi:hypothetical protein